MVSTVRMPRHVYYGKDAFLRVGQETAYLGKKALIISDQVMNELGYVDQCIKYLSDAKVDAVCYLDVNSEPTDQFVYESIALLKREGCDVVIALGGGSCIDTAKAVAVLATNGGEISHYMNAQKIAEEKALPLVAIPTTAGTGSEATDATVITNTATNVKMMIKQPAFLPEVAIVDPFLTMPSPKEISAATGIDALTHAVEAYISRRAHPFTDTLALSAIQLIVENIREAYNNGENIEAREKMAFAAMLAGVAFSNASVCLVHGMSRPIGALFHVPHGLSNAMLLPAVLEFSQEMCVDRLASIGRLIFPTMKGLLNDDIVSHVVQEMKQLCLDLRIPNLKTWGIKKQAFELVLEKMAQDAITSGSPANNPRVPSEAEIVELYKTCYDYQFSPSQSVNR